MEDRKFVGKRISHAAGTIGRCSDNSLWEMQAAEDGTGGRLTASLLGLFLVKRFIITAREKAQWEEDDPHGVTLLLHD